MAVQIIRASTVYALPSFLEDLVQRGSYFVYVMMNGSGLSIGFVGLSLCSTCKCIMCHVSE